MPLIQERATAITETVIREDVYVRTVTSTLTETIAATLRREDLMVEPEGAVELVDAAAAPRPADDPR